MIIISDLLEVKVIDNLRHFHRKRDIFKFHLGKVISEPTEVRVFHN